MITLSLSEKEVQLLERSINLSIKDYMKNSLIDDSEYKALEHIMGKLQQSHQIPGEPLVSSKEVSYQETLLEH